CASPPGCRRRRPSGCRSSSSASSAPTEPGTASTRPKRSNDDDEEEALMSTVKVAGIGWAQPGDDERLSNAELLYRSTRQALEDAGIKRDAITSAVTTSYDYVEGRNLSNQFTLDSIGGVMKSCDLRLSDDGVHSIAAGAMEALSEPGGVVVVGSVQMAGTELIDSTNRAVEETIFEP